jgi:hypothetical protein
VLGHVSHSLDAGEVDGLFHRNREAPRLVVVSDLQGQPDAFPDDPESRGQPVLPQGLRNQFVTEVGEPAGGPGQRGPG